MLNVAIKLNLCVLRGVLSAAGLSPVLQYSLISGIICANCVDVVRFNVCANLHELTLTSIRISKLFISTNLLARDNKFL